MLSVPPPSLSIIWKHLRAAFLKSLVNSSISLLACLASSSRLACRSASLFARATSMHSSHSSMSTWPSLSVSIAARAASRRDGTSRYCKFLLPQLIRNLITFWFDWTAVTCAQVNQ